MAIALRGKGQINQFGSTITLTPDVSAVADDWICLAVALDGVASGLTITWPAGFTERGTLSSAVIDGQKFAWADKIAGASEPASYDVTVTSTSYGGGIVIFSGVDTTTPRDVTPTANAAGTQASPVDNTAAGVASGSANRVLVYIGAPDFNNATVGSAAAPSASPATWTEHVDTARAYMILAIYSCLDAAGTHTSDVDAVFTVGGTGNEQAFLIALREAGGGGATTSPYYAYAQQ